MSDEKKRKKIEKVFIQNPMILFSNIAWVELHEAWQLPDAQEGDTRPALTLHIPYGTFEEIQELRSILALNEEEARDKIKEQKELMEASEMMKSVGIDMCQDHHDCEGCPAYDECNLPIKKPLKS